MYVQSIALVFKLALPNGSMGELRVKVATRKSRVGLSQLDLAKRGFGAGWKNENPPTVYPSP